ncbi:hypothetical protein SAMN04487969_11113 [Paenibacillus algorifonticola]|uniref:Phage-Barnase-EndoU-ColicinE5/D-RelE like nuclease 3 domain-containing protein n=1 Tax=Paenibacillus algorifonticola TaxID=684063 RepID=A0A1I2F5Z3_9BACL|nr:hypothetical protein [Paenibacillus algorifonticola]SFE99950.1 hypothetical protein SAMN04487969_11113 [Paenibacillus algorifonticola]
MGLFLFKDLVKSGTKQTVKATAKNVTTTLSEHAIKRALEWGISEFVLDDLLAGKSALYVGAVHYDDIIEKSRIIHDPGTGNTVVLAKYSNDVITVYRDSDGAAARRVKEGRWKKASWIFDLIK